MRRRALALSAVLLLAISATGTASAIVSVPTVGEAPESVGARDAHVRLVQVLDGADLGLTGIDGLAYAPEGGELLVVGASEGADSVLQAVSPLGQIRSVQPFEVGLPGASAVTYDPETGELVTASNGRVARVSTHDLQARGSARQVSPGTTGVALSADGSVLTVDGTAGTVSAGEGRPVTQLDAVVPLVGLAVAPDGRLYTVAADGDTIYEYGTDGSLLATRDIDDAGIDQPADIELAPSADPTDDASKLSLYVADSGTEASTSPEIAEFELEATALDASVLSATTATATVVNTIEGSVLDPDSPDPSGMTYNAGSDRLVMVDGEIEEEKNNTYAYPGTNGWVFPRTGSPTSATFDTTNDVCAATGSNIRNVEPVGIAHDPERNVYYVTRDGQNLLWELDASFAPLRCLALAGFGIADAEGVGYGGGDIFIADGTAGEIWRLDPGPNGVFGTTDGTGTIDDVVVNHFDTSALGQPDPEGVEYDTATGTLYVVSNKDGSPILEVTTTGTPVRTLNVSGATLESARGLTLAPGTNDVAQHAYVADARVDNNSNGGAIDGRIYEIAIGASSPTAPDTTIDSGPSGTVTTGDASFTFSGTPDTTSFECRLDGAPFGACTSPQTYAGLSDGSHTFEVRALAGTTADPTPASRTWTVDTGTSPPPPADNLLSNAGFELDANNDGLPDDWGTNTRFTRSNAVPAPEGSYVGRHLNNNAKTWQQVTVTAGETYQFSGMVNMPATSDSFSFQLNVQWRSGGSNVGSPVVIHNFTDDTAGAWVTKTASLTAPSGATAARVQMDGNSMNATGTAYVDAFFFGAGEPPPPTLDTTITSGPPATTTATDATFEFSGTAAVSFQCQLDNGTWSPCTSPHSIPGPLSLGDHTFAVAAIDSNGDADSTPATHTWTIVETSSNLLSNPGFELDENGNGIPDDWGSNAKFTRSSAVAPHGGTYAGRHFATNDSGYVVYQQVAASAGVTYDFSGWVNVPTTSDSFTMNLRIRFMNGGTTISTTTLQSITGPTSGWESIAGTRTAPEGTTAIRVMMAIKSLNASIYVDDFSLVAAP